MKLKRKLIGLLLSMIIVFCSGCRSNTDYTFDYQALNEAVVGVEIIYKRSWDDREQLYVFQEEEISPFLEEFCGIAFQVPVPPFGSALHYTVKLLYENGLCDYISAYGGERCNAKGEFVTRAPSCKYSNREAYYNLLSKYIELDPELDFGYSILFSSD